MQIEVSKTIPRVACTGLGERGWGWPGLLGFAGRKVCWHHSVRDSLVGGCSRSAHATARGCSLVYGSHGRRLWGEPEPQAVLFAKEAVQGGKV